jgi:hypothetical protein
MFGNGAWGWSFPITIPIWKNDETRSGDLRPFQTLFSMFGKGVWGWSFPMTIPIWNSDKTRLGDRRPVQTL